MRKVLIYLDQALKEPTGLAQAARLMYPQEQVDLYGLTLNPYEGGCESGCDHILLVSKEQLIDTQAQTLACVIEEIHQQEQFDAILIPSSYYGRLLAPRVAIKLKAGLVADVTGIESKQGIIEMIRPAYSGKLMARIESVGHGPIMMSVRAGVFDQKTESNKLPMIQHFTPHPIQKSGITFIQERVKPISKDIRDSQVLISGGGGILHHFDKLNTLALVLNAEVSASRQVVDMGVALRKIQVGQSGKTVSPKLYIALGISGSVQHIEGLKNVETIISVNTNKNAPICSLSDLVVEGDAVEFIDKLVNKIKSETLNFKEETQ